MTSLKFLQCDEPRQAIIVVSRVGAWPLIREM